MYYLEAHWPHLLKQSDYYYPFPDNTNREPEDNPDFFVIPHFSTCVYHHCVFKENRTTDACKDVTSNYFGQILHYVQSRYPYWNETSGRDHVVVLTWDQASEIFGFYSPVKRAIRSAIHLTQVGYVSPHDNFDYHKDIVIVPYNSHGHLANKAQVGNRGTFAYFRGSILDDPSYSFGVRQYLKELGNTSSSILTIKDTPSPSYFEELESVLFSLCPSGWSPWSPRLFDSIMSGAIPVIFADGTKLPFEDALNYRDFSIKLLNEQVYAIEHILAHIDETTIRRKLASVQVVKKHFAYHDPPKHFDAFDMAMAELSRKKRYKPVGNSYYFNS
jgi:hypothetical protein